MKLFGKLKHWHQRSSTQCASYEHGVSPSSIRLQTPLRATHNQASANVACPSENQERSASLPRRKKGHPKAFCRIVPSSNISARWMCTGDSSLVNATMIPKKVKAWRSTSRTGKILGRRCLAARILKVYRILSHSRLLGKAVPELFAGKPKLWLRSADVSWS